MISQPVPITNELFDKINEILSRSHKASALDFQLLKRQARSLINKNANGAYSILGMIAAEEGNPEEMRENYNKALKLAPLDSFTNINYNNSLQHLGFFSEALQHGKSMLKTMPKDPDVLDLVIKSAMGACRFNEALRYLQQTQESSTTFPDSKIIQVGVQLFQRWALEDDEAENLQNMVYGLLHSKGIHFLRHRVLAFEYENISYSIGIDLPIPEIVDLNFELADCFSQLENMRAEVIIFEYTSRKSIGL
jgi:tetratricopeptide (TPR) repeat protein